MFFYNIPGQNDIKEFLRQLVLQDKIPHAMLFSGNAGRGTLPLVRAFTSLLFCDNTRNGESCGECSNCKKTHRMSHPDIHITLPVVGSKKKSADFMQAWREMMLEHPFASISDWQNRASSDNKQLNINVAEIAEITEFASLKSYEGGKKVLIIWMAEYLQKEGNRLLKLIEEPPPGMFIFLLTENEEEILQTIHSRTQSVLVKPLQDEEIAHYLVEKLTMTEEKADKLAFQADGNMNLALKLIESPQDDWLQMFVEWMRACYMLKPHQLSDKVVQYAKLNREEQKYFLEVGLTTLDSIVQAKYRGRDQVRLSKDDLKPIDNLAKLLDLDQLFQLMQIINRSIVDIEQNVNSKVLFMRQSVHIHYVMHVLNLVEGE